MTAKIIKFPYERRGIINLKPEWEVKDTKPKSIVMSGAQFKDAMKVIQNKKITIEEAIPLLLAIYGK